MISNTNYPRFERNYNLLPTEFVSKYEIGSSKKFKKFIFDLREYKLSNEERQEIDDKIEKLNEEKTFLKIFYSDTSIYLNTIFSIIVSFSLVFFRYLILLVMNIIKSL